jgi:hypothetical protein
MSAMPLVAVSKDTIRANVIRFFHNEFGDPISWFKGSTNVRKGYKYTPEQWIEVGETISGLPWMRRLQVKLRPETDMPPLSTIDDLTCAIWRKLQKVVVVAEPIAALEVDAIEIFSAPEQRQPSARAKPRGVRKGRRVKAKRAKKTITKPTKKPRR